MKTDKISDLYALYIDRLKGDIWMGIPVLIISLLSGVYVVDIHLKYPFYIRLGTLLQCLAVGLIATDEFKGARFVLLGRVSTKDQLDNADFEDRLQPIRDLVIGELEGTIVEEVTGSESGATMERESLNKILEMAKADRFDVLAVKNLDRLTRAKPWNTIDYLLELQEADITIYEHPQKFYSWDDLADFERISRSLFFSREWYQRIAEGRRQGVFKELKKGRWPFQTHFGYDKDKEADSDERNIYLLDSKAPILYRIFDIYEQTENISKTREEINDRFTDELDEELTRSRVETVLNSKLCIGELEYESVVKNKISDLAAVPKEKFERVQMILESSSRERPDKVPESIVDATTKFGIEYVQSILEQISFRRCKKCGGELDPYSRTEVFDIPVEKVQCKSCDYDGILVSEKEFLEVHQTAPLRCPFCFRTEEFMVEESQHGLDMYQYECENCGREFHTSVSPGKVNRYLEYPDLGVKLEDKTLQSRTVSDDSAASEEISDSLNQKTLSDW